MAVKNSTILWKALNQGSNDFNLRVGDATQQTMSETVEKIFAPMNGRVYNEFIDILVQRIGETVMKSRTWENPLSIFKGSKLNYGSTVQEIAAKWIKSHTYEDSSTTLLKISRPEVQACFHTLNRQERYPITINRDELRQAFTEEYGLNAFVQGILDVPINSDNYDEYKAMMQLIGIYEDKWGFYKQQAAFPVDQDTAQTFLQSVRAYAGKLTFPNTIYNAGVVDTPCFAKPDELCLFILADALAAVDVRALAAAFNRSDSDFNIGRIILVDEFPIPDVFALLTTEDFFICKDVEYTTTSFYNPELLSTTYWVHHWEILSVSPFVPAILFTTAAGTTMPMKTFAATTYDITAETELVDGLVQLTPKLTGTIDGVAADIPPITSTTWEIVSASKSTIGPDSVTTDIALNSRTYVDRFNRLHLQKSGWYRNAADGTFEATNSITLKGKSTYINPSGETAELVDTITVSPVFDPEGNLVGLNN